MKTLIIAEKPDVAEHIADALGVEAHDDGHFESEGKNYIISSAAGHLLEKVDPNEEKGKRRRWLPENLLLISSEDLVLQPMQNGVKKHRLRKLTKLYRREDVGDVINACDAEREGELIFHYIMRHINGDKPVRRAWLRSLAKKDIISAFEDDALHESSEMEGLLLAATSRADADQTVGFNATRALTALFSNRYALATIGRVQTPTLAILVKRERERDAFQPRIYWEVHAELAAVASAHQGVWVHDKEAIAAHKGEKDFKPERIFDAAKADAAVADCNGKQGRLIKAVTEEFTPPPPLFDLISLQREANERFDMSAKETLNAMQSIYDQAKMATYPRTSSRHLPQGYVEKAKAVMEVLAKDRALGIGEYAGRIVEEDRKFSDADSRVFDDDKVGSHFAIIPNGENHDRAASLGGRAADIYEMICRRFVAAFSPPARDAVTEWRAEIGGHVFLIKRDAVEEDAGWRAVEPDIKENIKPETGEVLSEEEESVTVTAIEKRESATEPPVRYTEATLLSAMERAGGLVEDEELRAAMGERGLGTPATRAEIIEGLMDDKRSYLNRVGRELIPTWKADDLMLALAHLGQKVLAEAEMTAEWEQTLRDMEKGKGGKDAFMQKIEDLCCSVINKVSEIGKDPLLPCFAALAAPCPGCGGKVRERLLRFDCDSNECRFAFWKGKAHGRKFSAAEMETLLAKGTTGVLPGFISDGREISGEVKLEKREDGRWGALFVPEDAAREEKGEIVGACPKCGGKVHEGRNGYACECTACNFLIRRRILQREILPHEVQKLLKDGKSDLLHDFISRRSRRPFNAYLKLNLPSKKGKLEFEFPPRAAKKPAKKSSKK